MINVRGKVRRPEGSCDVPQGLGERQVQSRSSGMFLEWTKEGIYQR